MIDDSSPEKPQKGGNVSVGTPANKERNDAIRKRYKVVKSLAKISKEFRLSRSQIYRIVKGVNSKGHRTGGNTSKGGGNRDNTTFEIHDYAIKIPIQEKPARWKPNVILHKKKVDFRTKGKLKNTKVCVFSFSIASVHLSTQNVIIYVKETSPISADHARIRATQVALMLVPRLAGLLEIKLDYSNRIVFFDITSQHAVMLNDKVWDILKKAGFKSVKDEKGRMILYIDESDGKHIESDDGLRATEYVDNFAIAVGEYCQGAMTPKMVEATLSSILKVQKDTNKQLRAAAQQISNVASSVQCLLNLISPLQPAKHKKDELDRPPNYIG